MSTRHKFNKVRSQSKTSVPMKNGDRVHVGRTPNLTMTLLHNGAISIPMAIRELSGSTALGRLWGGELALERAQTTPDPVKAAELFDVAEHLFHSTVRLRHVVRGDHIDHISGKAQAHLANLPVSRLIRVDQLPQADLARSVYQQTTTVGRNLVNEHYSYRDHLAPLERRQMAGLASELAVLTLLQRFALAEGGPSPQTFFPMFALTSEDNRNTNGASVNHSWDVTAFGKTDDSLTLDYRVQVKSSRDPDRIDRPDEAGIAIVYANPDLKFMKTEKSVASLILRECFVEFTQPEVAESITQRLDYRTDSLFSVIDR